MRTDTQSIISEADSLARTHNLSMSDALMVLKISEIGHIELTINRIENNIKDMHGAICGSMGATDSMRRHLERIASELSAMNCELGRTMP